MKTLVFAYHDVGCEAIRALREMEEEIAAVFTHEDDARENVWFGSVKELAHRLKIPVFTPEDPNAREWIGKIKSFEPEIIYSFYYRKMICEDILRIPAKGALNLHGSLLPKYRGRAPVNWVLVNGEKETGLTLHHMVAKPDAGDIVAQKKVAIDRRDTALTLYRKLVPLAREILLEAVPQIAAGTAPRIPQVSSQATYFGGRKPEDGKIDWTKPSEEIYNLIRAVTRPYPGAFAFLDGKKVFIWKGETAEETGQKPGTILKLRPLTVACGKGALILEDVETEVKIEMGKTFE